MGYNEDTGLIDILEQRFRDLVDETVAPLSDGDG